MKGKTIGDLTVVRREKSLDTMVDINHNEKYKKIKMWKCKCSCGNVITIDENTLKNKTITSCGCKVEKYFNSKSIIRTETRLYKIYSSMLTRCYNKTRKYYERYGGRGIYVCDIWLKSKGGGFLPFYEWAIKSGYEDPEKDEPKRNWLTLDRIDNDGPYAPWNCRWIPKSEQSNNKSTSRYIDDGKQILTWRDFELKYSLPEGYVKVRKTYGWSDSAIVYSAKNKNQNIRKLHTRIAKSIGINETAYINKNGEVIKIPHIHEINS